MSTFCDKYEITKFKLGGLTPSSGPEVSEDSENPKNFKYLLHCTWKKENNSEEVSEYWQQLASPPLASPPATSNKK
ncbi:hypothetical protein [Mycoplasma wenyonii]|uniref:hypothetical protein n=1 Tax=Mycoplasma wenyonii TaxID=65123 RepID=UPI0005C46A6F|nr:hypothetical protein [Mycoplasma wenyonii]